MKENATETRGHVGILARNKTDVIFFIREKTQDQKV